MLCGSARRLKLHWDERVRDDVFVVAGVHTFNPNPNRLVSDRWTPRKELFVFRTLPTLLVTAVALAMKPSHVAGSGE